MIDLRRARLLDFVPESIASDPDIIALSLALDPELQDVGAAIIEALILPRIAELPEPVLNEIAWACRFNELHVWDLLTVEGKRTLLDKVFYLRRRSGTKFAVRRIFDALFFVAKVIEWFEEAETPGTYRIRVFLDEIGISLDQEIAITEWIRRFGRAGAKLRELAVESDRRTPLVIHPAVTVGHHTTIAFGGP